MKNKIEAERSIKKINECIEHLEWGTEEFISKLVNQLDPGKAKTPRIKEKIIELKEEY